MNDKKEWFTSWFDSPYYHNLYENRNNQEAADFVLHLIDLIQPKKESRILDVACGRGRHAIELSRLGYNVTGIDLSAESIKYASEQAKKRGVTEGLEFKVHDMRKPLAEKYNHIINLFTSFGYFSNPQDNFHVMQSFRHQLADNGVGVIDFLNPKWVVSNLVEKEDIKRDGILFSIRRNVDSRWLIKDIDIQTNRSHYHFQERVQLLEVDDFISLFTKVGLQLVDLFGDYQLGTYSRKKSNRQILVFQ